MIKKDLNQKDVDTTKDILLTEAEFEKKQRLKSKEHINRVTRVFGVLTIILLACIAMFEPFFEMSYFGALITPEEHNSIWVEMSSLSVFDDWLDFGNPWIAKIGITILIIVAAIFLVYFLTYTVVDLVDLFKNLFIFGQDLTKDLSGNIKATAESVGLATTQKKEKEKKVRKSLFSGDDVREDEVVKKEKKRRTEKEDTRTYEDLTTEQLDALLSGKPMEEVLQKNSDMTDINIKSLL